MSYKLSLAALVSLLSLSGCVIYADGSNSDDVSGSLDITMNLSFDSRTSCFAAGLDTVKVRFAGNDLQPVTVPCDRANGIAINYQGVYPGTYTAFIDGIDNGSVVYSGRFDFTVDYGVTSFLFDVPSASSGEAELVANFTFAAPSSQNTGGLSCKEAGVSKVNISIDDDTPFSVPCHDNGTNQDTAAISGLTSGTHSITFDVLDSHGETLYASRYDNVSLSSGSNEYDINVLGVAKGGLQIQWVFSDAPSCADAGVTDIDYRLVGPNNQVKTGTVSCATSGGDFNNITLSPQNGSPLAAGRYSLTYLSGRNGTMEWYNAGGEVGNLYVAAGDILAFEVTLSPAD